MNAHLNIGMFSFCWMMKRKRICKENQISDPFMSRHPLGVKCQFWNFIDFPSWNGEWFFFSPFFCPSSKEPFLSKLRLLIEHLLLGPDLMAAFYASIFFLSRATFSKINDALMNANRASLKKTGKSVISTMSKMPTPFLLFINQNSAAEPCTNECGLSCHALENDYLFPEYHECHQRLIGHARIIIKRLCLVYGMSNHHGQGQVRSQFGWWSSSRRE